MAVGTFPIAFFAAGLSALPVRAEGTVYAAALIKRTAAVVAALFVVIVKEMIFEFEVPAHSSPPLVVRVASKAARATRSYSRMRLRNQSSSGPLSAAG